jgi:hypothetical protein
VPCAETIPEAENQALAESRYNELLGKKFWNFLKDKKHLLIRRAAYQLLATVSHKARRTSHSATSQPPLFVLSFAERLCLESE